MRGGKMRLFMKGKNSDFKYAKGESDIYGKTFHTCYEIFFLLSGKAEFINEKTRMEISPGHLVIIPPGGYHQFIAENVKNYERCVLNIFPSILNEDIMRKTFAGKDIVKLSGKSRIKENMFHLMHCLKTADESDFAYICDSVAIDTVFCIKNLSAPEESPAESLPSKMVDIMSYINENFTENITVDMLSKQFHISVSTLCHNFKESYGISIKKFIIEKRMNASNMALQQGEAPEEVCEKYGFSNYSTFYRDYKKYFGVSPSETVKEQRLP